MSVYEGIMQGLAEAVDCQQGKIPLRKAKLTIKPVTAFNTDDIKQIRQKIGLSQVVFVGSLGVCLKTVKSWKNGRNKTKMVSRHMFEVVRYDPWFLMWFQAEGGLKT
jgi:putative transcriptional regulator